jgi:hypothetical protein
MSALGQKGLTRMDNHPYMLMIFADDSTWIGLREEIKLYDATNVKAIIALRSIPYVSSSANQKRQELANA